MIKIMLDMDGVLSDFVGGAAKAHGNYNPYDNPDNHGKYEIEECWDMHPDHFWRPIKSQGWQFWAYMEPTKEAGTILSLASRYDPECAILTSCTDDDCVKGKKYWTEEVFPKLRNRMIFTGSADAKRMLANSNSVLIDDKDSNIDEWKSAGGHGFLFPRPWNSAHRFSPETGLKELENFLYELSMDEIDKEAEPQSRSRLPIDPKERKNIPIGTGFLDYFPLAIIGGARCSMVGNEQHNPGEPLHWARGKSMDHYNALQRHLMDRELIDTDGIPHVDHAFWRMGALSQEWHERNDR